ncbi:MAG TPA: hypothetical protein VK636_13335 [Gemmatimonadaceae bacterium]|nr:hypothetical protein [Gemmatimonadaceae bacterium]
MGTRPIVTAFDGAKLDLDHGSWRSLVLAVDGNNFTGCMDLETGKIYFAPLGPSPVAAENHYETILPTFPCFVGGPRTRSFTRTSPVGRPAISSWPST